MDQDTSQTRVCLNLRLLEEVGGLEVGGLEVSPLRNRNWDQRILWEILPIASAI